MRKFIIQCQNEKCKKVILKENPEAKVEMGSFKRKGEDELLNISAVDSDTGEPVVLPNVWCKHCKHKNLITVKDLIDTDNMDLNARKNLNVKIKADVKKAGNEVDGF